MTKKPLMSMRGVTKRFPGVLALDNMTIDLYPGEVHVLIGENGAGKSTLVKILSGVYQMDGGQIEYLGEKLDIHGVKDAQDKGISIIHQELNLLPHRTIYQNIFLGREQLKGKVIKTIDKNMMISKTKELLDRLNIDLDPCATVKTLSIAQRQMIEVAKAIMFDLKVLIMDEPTSSITVKEIESLFNIVKDLKKKGVAIIYISHRMEEIKQIGDRVTVMRDGKYIGTRDVQGASLDELVEMMVGRKIEQLYHKVDNEPGAILLKTHNLCGLRFKDVNITVKRGEVVSLAGLVGAGRTEIAKAIFGYDEITGGTLEFKGETFSKTTPNKMTKLGLGFLPEDRRDEGLVLNMSVENNTILASLSDIFKTNLVNRKKSQENAEKYTKMLTLSPANVKNVVSNLSGGNQQKVVLARWLCKKCDLFIFDEPTRGVDVGAKADIYKLVNELASNGAGVLVISSDLPEVVGLSDRVYVVNDGFVVAELSKDDINQQNIGKCMVGGGR